MTNKEFYALKSVKELFKEFKDKVTYESMVLDDYCAKYCTEYCTEHCMLSDEEILDKWLESEREV